ncbi:hypothetical protein XHV734_2047 [Xanthomonas hortorum pv. vitians]|nr:hypothetical protein XHV734_2047 [Xanthomonas hortorum pv. vitians]
MVGGQGPCSKSADQPRTNMPMTLQGLTCGVSRDGGRARALPQTRRSAANPPVDDA